MIEAIVPISLPVASMTWALEIGLLAGIVALLQ
jgi:hypothetical protein